MSERQWWLYFVGILALSGVLMFWELDNVDLEASEDIYMADAVSYLRHDPYMFPRQHLRKSHAPASPHPFLVPLLSAEIFKIFGLSVYGARILSSLSVVLSSFMVMLISKSLFRSNIVSITAGLVFATSPFEALNLFLEKM